MKLSEAIAHIEGELVRDGDFSVIAFATEREQTNFLTFLEKKSFSLPLTMKTYPVCCVRRN